MASATSPSSNVAAIVWPLLFCALGIGFIVAPSIWQGRFPGDMVDGRFNNYVLEHVTRWMRGAETSLWNPRFFYPFEHVLAFSDSLLGSSPVYAVFRVLGADRWQAYRAWYVTGFALNFIACHVALRRLSGSAIAAAFGAFVFTFSLPVFGQETHVQLLYRCGVPIAVVALCRLDAAPRPRTIAWLVGAVSWQFFASIYLGFFLLLLLAAVAIGLAVTANRTRGGPVGRIAEHWLNRWKVAWQSATSNECRIAAALVGVCLAAVFVLFLPYVEVTLEYGFHRSWGAVAPYLPRPKSYLLADQSHLWAWLGRSFHHIPMRAESEMFVGAVPLLLLVYAVTRATDHRRLVAVSGLALLGLMLLTLSVRDWSLYAPLSLVPGFSSIRAVARIVLVMLMPLAMLSALAVDDIVRSHAGRPAAYGFVLLLFAAALGEDAWIAHDTSATAMWQARVDDLAATLPEHLPSRPILSVAGRPGENPDARDVDAMILAQDKGWSTVNGYSGNYPPITRQTGHCAMGTERLAEFDAFHHRPSGEVTLDAVSRLVPLGFTDCR